MSKEKVCEKKVSLIFKIFITIGVMVAFCKLPTIVAEKISYYKIKRKPIKQDLTEE